MIFNMICGGGGSANLNFSVVAYPSEESLPATAEENTIAIITNAEITSWILSLSEPSEPSEGMVWIKIGTSSPVEFNALKENGIQICPISASQYISGAWITVTAKSFQNGWVNWIVYLFNNGDNESVSGGWTTVAGKITASNGGTLSGGQPSCTVYSDRIVINTNDGMGFLRHNNLIDLTPYTKVHYSGTANANAYTNLGYCQPIIMPYGATNSADALKMGGLSAFGSFSDLQVDVTNINKEAYIGWWLYDYGNAGANATVTITKIWLT